MAPSTAKPTAPSGSAPAPLKQKALARMQNYVGQRIETLEICYSGLALDGARVWRTDMAKAEHRTLGDILQTLTLVEAVERDFKELLRKKLGKRPMMKGAQNERQVAPPDGEADADSETP